MRAGRGPTIKAMGFCLAAGRDDGGTAGWTTGLVGPMGDPVRHHHLFHRAVHWTSILSNNACGAIGVAGRVGAHILGRPVWSGFGVRQVERLMCGQGLELARWNGWCARSGQGGSRKCQPWRSERDSHEALCISAYDYEELGGYLYLFCQSACLSIRVCGGVSNVSAGLSARQCAYPSICWRILELVMSPQSVSP